MKVRRNSGKLFQMSGPQTVNARRPKSERVRRSGGQSWASGSWVCSADGGLNVPQTRTKPGSLPTRAVLQYKVRFLGRFN